MTNLKISYIKILEFFLKKYRYTCSHTKCICIKKRNSSLVLYYVLFKRKYRMLIYCMVVAGPHVFLEKIQCILFAVNVFIIVLFNLA